MNELDLYIKKSHNALFCMVVSTSGQCQHFEDVCPEVGFIKVFLELRFNYNACGRP
jgi:hypothetical protein